MKNIALKSRYYPIIIGNNSLRSLSKEIPGRFPETKKIAIILDKRVPKKFSIKIKRVLKRYEVFIFSTSSSEKIKSFNKSSYFIDKLLYFNFNRSDILIGMGGGIVGDLAGFVASIYKRGINFINIPTTLLSQVDSCIGGKTGVNSKYGKNLIGSFYQPKLVLIDISFLKSLPQREVICGYAEILKHAIIYDLKFFKWLKFNTGKLLMKNEKTLLEGIKKSCQIKLKFTEKDFKEKNFRMILNFGHTFAHALEANSKYSKINHGEAVLIGMKIATRISLLKKTCTMKTLNEIELIYSKNNLLKNLARYNNKKTILRSIAYMKNDKKNNDEKINLILLKRIGKTSIPGTHKYSVSQLKKIILNLF